MSVARILGMNPEGENSVLRTPITKRTLSLPPLIKIDQAVPVGYSPMQNHQYHDSEPTTPHTETSSTEVNKMPSILDNNSPYPHYRPTVINIPNPTTTTTTTTTMTPVDITPRPLVPTPDSDRPERMRDWLVRMINSGQFPGLTWLDKEKAIFRVPWIHAKKRDYNQERDAALFREWAIHSGKYGDGSDVTTWKINFRCALNGLKDIIERRELEEPDCRVYQMLPSSNTGRRRNRKRPRPYYSEMYQPPERDVRSKVDLASPATTPLLPPAGTITPTSAATPIQVFPIVTGTTPFIPISGFPSPTITTAQMPQGIMQRIGSLVPVTVRSPLPPPELRSDSPSYQDGSSQPQTPRTPVSPAVQQSSPKVISPPLFSPYQPDHTTTTLGVVPTIPMHPMHPMLIRTGPIYCPPTEFCDNPSAVTVRIMYGSITVYLESFDCSAGARIYYGPLHCRDVLPPTVEEKLFGPLGAHQISLSPRHPAPLAKEIFNTAKRGLVLEIEDQCLYATALCRAVVYHGSSPLKCTAALQKENRLKVFSYPHRFFPDLSHYSKGHGIAPKPYVIFSLGQTWGAERPLSKNLVSIVVTYCKALNDLRVRNIPIHDELLFEAQESKDIRIISPTAGDLAAEEFLNPGTSA